MQTLAVLDGSSPIVRKISLILYSTYCFNSLANPIVYCFYSKSASLRYNHVHMYLHVSIESSCILRLNTSICVFVSRKNQFCAKVMGCGCCRLLKRVFRIGNAPATSSAKTVGTFEETLFETRVSVRNGKNNSFLSKIVKQSSVAVEPNRGKDNEGNV